MIAAANATGLNGQTLLDYVTGETLDMSPCLDFGLCDWMWHKEKSCLDTPMLGKFIGIAESV